MSEAKNAKKLIPDRLPQGDDQQSKFDALSLIKTGKRLGDDLSVRIGQARLRYLENRATAEDLELLNIELKKP